MIAGAELDRLARALAVATDDRVLRVVATIDAMPVRGGADALLAPLRDRFGRLRPSRPLNLTRLLFAPLDPVIIPAPEWRSGGPGVPRPALAVLAREVRRVWPDLDQLQPPLRDLTMADTARLEEIGAPIWGRAASILAAGECPPDWAALTGLADEDHAPVVLAATLILPLEPALLRLRDVPVVDGFLDAELARLCAAALAHFRAVTRAARAAAATPAAPGTAPLPSLAPLASFAAALVLRSPRAGRALAALRTVGGVTGDAALATRMGLDFVLDGLIAAATRAGLGQAADALPRAAALLDDLETLPQDHAAERLRARETRAALDIACRTRFAQAVASVLGAPDGAAERRGDDDAASARNVAWAQAAREDLAHEAHRFERAARRIGGADAYDQALRLCATAMAAPDDRPDATGGSAGGAPERARLAAILAGDQPPLSR